MIDSTPTSLWVERYRPDTLEGYIGNAAIKAKFTQFIENQDIPHLLLTGPAGTGKTTAAKILLKGINADVMSINASDENNIDTVRTKIRSFASTCGFEDLKIMLLDEFDGFTQQGQGALRNIMEEHSHTTRFILTANYLERIIPPIISRTQQFHVTPPSMKEVAMHVAGILTKEGVKFALPSLKLLVEAHYPDIRKIINEAQLATRDGELVVDAKEIYESDAKLKIIAILKGSVSGKLQAIRKIVADSQMRDFSDMYRILYDHILEYGSANVPQIILAIAEGQHRDAVVVDKEINFAATIVNILAAIE
jgi:DNA polymerase III delta prime subunit